jgi:hypothetical protein
VVRCLQSAAAVRNEEAHVSSSRIVEPPYIPEVPRGDVEVVVGAKRNSYCIVVARVGEFVDECTRRWVVAPDTEGTARDVEVAVGAKRQGRRNSKTARGDWVSFPKIPSGDDWRRETESLHDL